MFLFYIRHGDPIYEPDGLTEKGKIQADALSKRFLKFGLDKIYSSTSERAKMTAEPTARLLGKDIELLDFANENHAARDFGVRRDGKWNWGFFDAEVKRLFKSEEVFKMGRDWYKSPLFEEYNFRQGIERVRGETIKLIESFGYEYNPEKMTYKSVKHLYDRVALFAHGGFGVAFLSEISNIPYPTFATTFSHLHCTSVCVIEIKDEGDDIRPEIVQYGNDSHLYKDDLSRELNGKNAF